MSLDNNEKKIRDILTGIDKTEYDDSFGWWETSSDVDFSDRKMKQLIKTFKYHLDPSEIFGFIAYIVTFELTSDLKVPDKDEAVNILNRYVAQRSQ